MSPLKKDRHNTLIVCKLNLLLYFYYNEYYHLKNIKIRIILNYIIKIFNYSCYSLFRLFDSKYKHFVPSRGALHGSIPFLCVNAFALSGRYPRTSF